MTPLLRSAHGFHAATALFASLLLALPLAAQTAPASPLAAARLALLQKHYVQAKALYRAGLATDPGSVEARLGLADTELALHEYQAAELDYRAVTAAQPQQWLAHKNLVIVEAALGRWDEFDRERAVLRGARLRGAPGITLHESDIIDTFDVRGTHWIVREYAAPAGRSRTLFNFESFTPEGRIAEYISLESQAAADSATPGGAVTIGPENAAPGPGEVFALNIYSAHAHSTITSYPAGVPGYEKVRADVLRYLRRPRN